MPKVVLTTIGTLGDLHPFIAIGRALRRRGAEVVLGVPQDHVDRVRAAGLVAAPVLPGFAEIAAATGLDEEAVIRRVMADTGGFLFDKVLLPNLSRSAAALDVIAADADVLVASLFMFAAPIVAEKRKLPFVPVVLQPMTLFSAFDPPRTPDAWMLRRSPGALGRGWNRLIFATARKALAFRYCERVDAVRVEHGLARNRHGPSLTPSADAASVLCCWSPLMGPLPPDAPPRAVFTGFPIYDGEAVTLDAELTNFLRSGPPPLVFTLGSFAVYAPGDFYDQAAEAARRLGLRAVLLMGEQASAPPDRAVLARDYVPHSALFPHAAAVIHHGGVGTTAQALLAGKPQLIAPHMGDQYDNGWRVERLGAGRNLRSERFGAATAAAMLSDLLNDPSCLAAAKRAAAEMRREDGAELAADAVLASI